MTRKGKPPGPGIGELVVGMFDAKTIELRKTIAARDAEIKQLRIEIAELNLKLGESAREKA